MKKIAVIFSIIIIMIGCKPKQYITNETVKKDTTVFIPIESRTTGGVLIYDYLLNGAEIETKQGILTIKPRYEQDTMKKILTKKINKQSTEHIQQDETPLYDWEFSTKTDTIQYDYTAETNTTTIEPEKQPTFWENVSGKPWIALILLVVLIAIIQVKKLFFS